MMYLNKIKNHVQLLYKECKEELKEDLSCYEDVFLAAQKKAYAEVLEYINEIDDSKVCSSLHCPAIKEIKTKEFEYIKDVPKWKSQ